jgi:DNA-binding transcriptional MerR regulator
MTDRAHLSIGEVLSLLQDDFPDVTISKIRFLESQGLLDPERTPSGYRKFYEPDIERLRWILRHQRDHFLPLKVIKDRLEESAAAGLSVPPDEPAAPPTPPVPSLFEQGDADEAGRAEPASPPAASTAAVTALIEAPAPAPSRPTPAPEPPPARPSRPAPSLPPLPASPAAANPLDAGPSGVSFTLEELGSASGLSLRELGDLTRFGLLAGYQVGGDTFYDGDALVVARTAAGFMRFGIEARHLRMYKVAAEREAGFMEQVVMPLLKQRNPTARQQAADNLGEMARLGEQLRTALLRAALRDHTDPGR